MNKLIILLLFFISCEQLTPKEKLMGVDRNQNGIRDDVDELIKEVSSDGDQKMALEQYSSYLRKTFTTYQRKKTSNANTKELFRAGSCLLYILKWDTSKQRMLTKKLRKLTFKSKEQLEILMKRNMHMSGEMTGQDVNSTNCDFNLKGKYK